MKRGRKEPSKMKLELNPMILFWKSLGLDYGLGALSGKCLQRSCTGSHNQRD